MKQGIVGGAIGAALVMAVVAGAGRAGKAEAQGPACRMIGAASNTFENYLNRMVGEGYSVKAAGSEMDGGMWAIMCR